MSKYRGIKKYKICKCLKIRWSIFKKTLYSPSQCSLVSFVGVNFVVMFIMVIYKVAKSTGERVSCYRLCESYRFDNTIKHTGILHLGRLEELPGVEQKRALAIRLNKLARESYTGIKTLFEPEAAVEKLAIFFFSQIKEKQRLDITSGKDYQRIDTDFIKHKEVKEIGTDPIAIG